MTSSATSPAATSRRLVRSATKGALGSLRRDGGGPYVSMVLVATAADGAPILLMSDLALHTKNLQADQRASLLIDGTDGLGDPMTGARISLVGILRRTMDAEARARYLARHPHAAGYADFADFSFYRFEPDFGHLIEGFGRIIDVDRAGLLDRDGGPAAKA